MGVNGLWKILEETGRPVKLEALAKRRLAIDASIWIYHFLKAVRDKEGNAFRCSHIVGFFRRICKLLFFGIKPVFVFDGSAPIIKQKTIAARKQRTATSEENLAITAGRILQQQLRDHIVSEIVTTTDAPSKYLNTSTVDLNESQKSSNQADEVNRFRRLDQFHLPDIDASSYLATDDDMRIIGDNEIRERDGIVETCTNNYTDNFAPVNFDSQSFQSLPSTDKYFILNNARLRSRLRMGISKEQLCSMFSNDLEFSKFQIERVKERNDLTQRLMHFNGVIDKSGSRIASEKGRAYILAKNENEYGGWSLSLEPGPHIIEESNIKEKSSSDDVDEVFENIPINVNEIVKSSSNLFDQQFQITNNFDAKPGKEFDRIYSISKKIHNDYNESNPLKKMRVTTHENHIKFVPDGSGKNQEAELVQKLHSPIESSAMMTKFSEAFVIENGLNMNRLETDAVSDDINPTLNTNTATMTWQVEQNTACSPNTKHDNVNKEVIDDHIMSIYYREGINNQFNDTNNIPFTKDTCKTTEISIKSGVSSSNRNDDIYDNLLNSKPILSTLNNSNFEKQTVYPIESALITKLHEELSERFNKRHRAIGKDFTILQQDATSTKYPMNITECVEDYNTAMLRDETITSPYTSKKRNLSDETITSPYTSKKRNLSEIEDINLHKSDLQPFMETFMNSHNEKRGTLRDQQKQHRRDADAINDLMIEECQELLRLFGLPFINAPMEAEAQCAELLQLGLVDGIVTDDSDIFLFGGTQVFKNLFNRAKAVECYSVADFERKLNIDRDKLIKLAHLLGSDYAPGVPNVGPVLALEILSEFNSKDGLQQFKNWLGCVQKGLHNPIEDSYDIPRSLYRKAAKLQLPVEFANECVDNAYLHPEVDDNPEKFQWGKPDMDALRKFLVHTIGWDEVRVDEVLLPVIRDMNIRQTEGIQSNITTFLASPLAPTSHSSHKKFVNSSRRMQQAFTKLSSHSELPALSNDEFYYENQKVNDRDDVNHIPNTQASYKSKNCIQHKRNRGA